MSKSQTRKIEKWKKSHPNTTRTEVAKLNKAIRYEKVKAHLAEVALIASPSKCRKCKKTFDSSVLQDGRCVKCHLKRLSNLKRKRDVGKQPTYNF